MPQMKELNVIGPIITSFPPWLIAQYNIYFIYFNAQKE